MTLAPSRMYSAREAAITLGQPSCAKTLTRRAREAYYAGDARVQQQGNRWIAPLGFWREAMPLRKSGRPRGSRNGYRKRPGWVAPDDPWDRGGQYVDYGTD